MARLSRSRLSAIGIGALSVLLGTLVVPPGSSAAVVTGSEATASDRMASDRIASDRIATVAGARGRSAFEFQPASGDRQAPFGFVSTDGTVRARQLGGAARTEARAVTGAPRRTMRASATATTYKTTLTVDSEYGGAWNSFINLWNRDTWSSVSVPQPQNSLSTSVRLPAGNYYATAMYGRENSYLLTKTFTISNQAKTVHLDEKSAKEVAIKVNDTTARQEQSAVWISLPNEDLVGFAGGPRSRTYVSTASLPGTTLRARALLTKAGSTVFKPSPYRYDLFKSWAHPLPASPITTVKTASLARTTLTVRSQGSDGDGWYQTVPEIGELFGAYLQTPMRAPSTITEYVTPGVTMSRYFDYDNNQGFTLHERSLPAGVSAGETVGAGPLGPNSWTPGGDYSRRYSGTDLYLREYRTFGDTAGNKGVDADAASTTTLSSGGEVLGTTTDRGLSVTVSPTAQTFQLDNTTIRRGPWSQLSTKVQSKWTFVSNRRAIGDLPLIDLAVTASGLDRRNHAGAAPVLLTVTPSTRRVSAVTTMTAVEWSVDDGVTWAELPLTPSGQGVQASLAVPDTAAFVSLRFTASDDQGGALTRTVTHAVGGPATPGNKSIGNTTISAVKVNGGRPLIVGTPAVDAGPRWVPTTFTVSDPSGVANAGVLLWHGTRNAPDGLLQADASCVRSTATTSKCTAEVPIWDQRYSLSKNTLAGLWRAEVWASAANGTSLIDRPAAAGLIFKRDTRLTANAAPEPVKKNKKITVTGSLTRADWGSWTFKPYASRTLKLQRARGRTSNYTNVKNAKSGAKGTLKTTVKATVDGSFRWTFAGDATSDKATSAGDYIDVRK